MNVLLTEREHEIVEALLAYPDLRHAQLAEALHTSAKTLDIHIGHILRKTGYRTTCGLLVDLMHYLYTERENNG